MTDAHVPTKQGPGYQPLPKSDNPRRGSHELLAADIMDRLAVGMDRYGEALKPMNGRDTALDAYEEVLDLAVYMRTLMMEREEIRGVVGCLIDRFESYYAPIGSDGLNEVVRADFALITSWLEGKPLS